MTQVIEQIIRLNVELEGALRVAAARPSDEALTAAAEKLEQINSLFSELKAPEALSENSETSECSECSEAAAEPIDAVEAIAAVEAPASEISEISECSEPAEPVAAAAAPVFRDIRKNLTINDKFLFKRELFNGSNEEFNDTLDLISTMHSLAEAEEYLYEDMALDPDNDTVKDFIALVTNYFNQK